VNDIDNDVKRLLNEQVDARLGPRRSPPPFTPPAAAERGKRRWFGADRASWVLPLVAAACVAGVVGATIGAGGLLADDSTTAPGHSPAPVPSPHSTTEPNHLTYQTIAVGGATLVIPDGWQVTDAPGVPQGRRWCLNPTGAAGIRCTIAFQSMSAFAAGRPVDVDVDRRGFGVVDPPRFCENDAVRFTEQTGDRAFGGRGADWRRWAGTCPDGSAFAIEQYVVATNPGYALFAAPADARTHAAMNEIVQYSFLPRQSDPLRLMDRGILTSVDRAADGVTVTIDRVVLSETERVTVVNLNPTTYRYLVPTSVYDAAHVSVGDRVKIETDGLQVLKLYREAG
jgi:hypothetical protein